MPLFNNVCGLSLTVACKILAVIHLIGSIIYIGMGASVLAADDVTKSHQIAYSITIACTVLNVLNSFLLYFGVDKGKDKYLLPTFVLMIILVIGSTIRVVDGDYSHIVSIFVCILTEPIVYSAWQEIKGN